MSPTYLTSTSQSGKRVAEAIDRLKAKKTSLRLSNKQIADSSKGALSESAVQRFFSGETADPSMQTFLEVASAMGVTIEEAFGAKTPASTFALIEHDVCEKRIAEQKEHYEAQLAQCRERFKEQLSSQKELYESQQKVYEAQQKRQTIWLSVVVAAFLTLVAIVIFFVIYDVTHPSLGWVQYNRSVTLEPDTTTADGLVAWLRRLLYAIL